MNKIGLIVEREFTERVRKKSFIITTLLTPLFMIALMVAPGLMMTKGGSSTKTITVVDNTEGQFVGKKLESGETVKFNLLPQGTTSGQARSQYNDVDVSYGILVIGNDVLDNPQNIQLILNDASSMNVEENIRNQIQGILRTERLSRYEMDNIDQILADANIRVSFQTLKNNGQEDDESSMEETSTVTSWLMGLILGMLLYFILIVYGQQVLQSVIDEKQTRVLDVMVTSCKPFDLMMGKILGIALVAALQIVIWAVLVIGASAFIMPMVMGDAGVDAAMAAASAVSDPEISGILSKFTNIGYLAGLFLELLLYLVTEVVHLEPHVTLHGVTHIGFYRTVPTVAVHDVEQTTLSESRFHTAKAECLVGLTIHQSLTVEDCLDQFHGQILGLFTVDDALCLFKSLQIRL